MKSSASRLICSPSASGEYKAYVRLTIDLIPEIKITVHREGETAEPEAEAAPQMKRNRSGPRVRKNAEEPKPAEAEAKE